MKKQITASTLALTILFIAIGCQNAERTTGRIHASGHIEATEVRIAAKVGDGCSRRPSRRVTTWRAGAWWPGSRPSTPSTSWLRPGPTPKPPTHS